MAMTQSERAAANEERYTLRELLEALPGGAGVYEYSADGTVTEKLLNDRYYAMIGAVRDERAAFTGASALSATHPDDRAALLATAGKLLAGDTQGNVEMRLLFGDGQYHWVVVRARVTQRTAKTCTVLAIYADIDEQKKSRLRNQMAQRALSLAATHGNMTMWLYNLDQKRITQDFIAVSPYGFPMRVENVPESLIGTGDFSPETEPELARMHRELDAGAETSECTLKMRNRHTGRYEWQHLIYNRLHGDEDGDRLAVGFTTNVDLQQDALRRYEHELLIRRELIRDSLTFYQINLTTGMIEEYSTKLSNMPVVKTPFPNNEDLCEMLLAGITPEYRQAVRETLFSDALMERYRQGKTSVSLVFRRIVPERGTCWVKCTATIIKKPLTNEIVAFINTASVDGERKDELAIQSIIEDEIEFMLLINVRSGMARVSKYRSAMSYQSNSTFPYDEQILLALDVEAHPDDRALCAAFFPLDGLQKALAQDARARLTYRIADAQGIKRKQARAFYLDDTREDIVLVRRDITDLYEEEQRRQQTLKDAVDLANAANHAKSEFLSRMSHDMRTPLNAIIALSGEDMTADATPPQKDEFLEKIHASGKYLLGIINDVLDMSRIEGNKFSLRPVPYAMEEFIGTINTVIASQCRAKGLRFEFQFAGLTFPWALVDKVRFNQIFINLLTNAIKFTPPGGTVAFVIETLGREGDRVRKRFTVRDSGIGMSREFLPLAFDSFAQENQAGAAEAEQGTGLGLSIVKQIVELMGGTISVESELGKGTTFTVELAYTGVDAPRDDAYDGAEDIPEGLRVLLCEDHALNARITTALLEKKGCTVDCACNGREGLRMFAQSPPFFYGIVLMDIRMPVMDGLAATRAIRALDRRDAARVPIIALTADAFVEDAKTSLDTGMNDHLAKPIEPALLYRTIAKHARRARKEDVCTRD